MNDYLPTRVERRSTSSASHSRGLPPLKRVRGGREGGRRKEEGGRKSGGAGGREGQIREWRKGEAKRGKRRTRSGKKRENNNNKRRRKKKRRKRRRKGTQTRQRDGAVCLCFGPCSSASVLLGVCC